jgi:hypothetical protein
VRDDPRGGRGRQFSKAKIRALDDRKLARVEVERTRDMWELRCNRALRKARMSEGVNRGSLKAQGLIVRRQSTLARKRPP